MDRHFFYNRRQFISVAAITVGGSQLGPVVTAVRQGIMPDNETEEESIVPGWNIKQVTTGSLEVVYAEAGPGDGKPIILLHGWPYDIWSFAEVVPILVSKGYRVLLPYARGFGGTRFRSDKIQRNGQQAALASDVIEFMDAMQIPKAVLAGFDWGARSANIVAAVWPERCQAIVAVSGYIVVDRVANRKPLLPEAELGWWYQYYFSTARGKAGYEENVNEFNKLIWKLASPKWDFDEATFLRSAASFSNPDHADIVVHNYRWRLELAQGEPGYQVIEEQLTSETVIAVPSITIGSDFDGTTADGIKYRRRFTGKYEHRRLDGIGHNVPQEAPQEFALAILAAVNLAR
jgi:pimeloyl-ACP methyl ester carboxylesterase